MEKQKHKVIPTVNNIPVTNYSASSNFITDIIEFHSSTRWCLNVQNYSSMTAVAPTITILHSNEENGDFVPYDDLAIDVDIKVSYDRAIYDDIFPSRYMKIQFKSGGSSGIFSLVLSK